MPEGDSLEQAALRLAPVLVGQHVTSFWARKLRGHSPRAGWLIENVRAQGKHLLIEFERNLTLQSHLGMTGSWRVAEAGWAQPARMPKLRVVIGVEGAEALCFAAPTIQTFVRTGPTPVDRLGPDLLDAEPDFAEVVRRARGVAPTTAVMDLVMNQQVAAGIGNVYKSELLFLRRLDPYTPVGNLSDDQIEQLYREAAKQLRRNVDASQRNARHRRSTTADGRLFVYGRYRLACRRCGGNVDRNYDDVQGRSTYWCPACQSP